MDTLLVLVALSSHDGSQYVTTAVAHLQLTYGGSLAGDKWVSLVDDTLNSNFPCADGAVAAASADSLFGCGTGIKLSGDI